MQLNSADLDRWITTPPHYKDDDMCPDCEGSGVTDEDDTKCTNCNGLGWLEYEPPERDWDLETKDRRYNDTRDCDYNYDI